MTAAGTVPAGMTDTTPSAVSGDGQIIVGWGVAPQGDVALIWDTLHGTRSLEAALQSDYAFSASLQGWKLQRATGLSSDGNTVVGYGINRAGQTEGWRIRFTPSMNN